MSTLRRALMSASTRFWISSQAAHMAGCAGVFGGKSSRTKTTSTAATIQLNKLASSERGDWLFDARDNQSAMAGQASSSSHSWKMMRLFQIPMVFTYEATFGQTEKIPIAAQNFAYSRAGPPERQSKPAAINPSISRNARSAV